MFVKKWENPFQKTTSLLIQILSAANEWNISSSLTRHVENYLTNFFEEKFKVFSWSVEKRFGGSFFKKKMSRVGNIVVGRFYIFKLCQ